MTKGRPIQSLTRKWCKPRFSLIFLSSKKEIRSFIWIADSHLKVRQNKSCYANKMFACGHTSLSLCLVSDHFHKITQLVPVVISLTGPILDLTRVLLSCLSELQGCLIMEWSIDLKMFISSIQICAVPFCYQGFFFPRTKFREWFL